VRKADMTYTSDVLPQYLLARNEKHYRKILKTDNAGVKLSPVQPITIQNKVF
jgi:hypothetical protein